MQRTNISVPCGQRKTRNQRKRERRQTLMLTVLSIIMAAIVSVMMFKEWVNEPTISEAEHRAYIETLRGDK